MRAKVLIEDAELAANRLRREPFVVQETAPSPEPTPVVTPERNAPGPPVPRAMLLIFGSATFLTVGYALFRGWRLLVYLRGERELHAGFSRERGLWRLAGELEQPEGEVWLSGAAKRGLDFEPESAGPGGIQDLVAPEDLAGFRSAIERAAAKGAGNTGQCEGVQCRLRTRDGRLAPVAGVVRVRRQGRRRVWVALLEDVRWQDNLQATQARLEALLETRGSAGGVLMLDERQEVVAADEAFCRRSHLSTPREQLRGQPLARIGGGVTRKLVQTLTGKAPPTNFPLTFGDGSTLAVEVTPVLAGARPVGQLLCFREAARERPAEAPPATPAVVAQPATFADHPADGPWCPEPLQPLLPWVPEFVYEDQDAKRTRTAHHGWQLAGATRRGRLHAHHRTHREDAFTWGRDENFTIVCVSDGAGSSRYSRIGSECACREVVRALREELGRLDPPPPAGAADDALATALAGAMGRSVWQASVFLHDLAARSGAEPKDFRCTFLLVVHFESPAGAVMLGSQVGDGFIAGLHRDGTTRRFGTADSGEFSGQVSCFLPEAEAVRKAGQIFRLPHEELEAVLLATDGIEDPFFPIEKQVGAVFRQLFVGVERPLSGFEEQPPHGPAIGPGADPAALPAWLSFEKRGENDDRTLVALYRDPTRFDMATLPSA